MSVPDTTDGQTDEHHGNSAMIRSNERHRALKKKVRYTIQMQPYTS